MNLLFIANTCPLPATNGLTLRSSSVLRSLVALGHRISLLSFLETPLSPEAEQELSDLCVQRQLIPAEFGNVSSAGKYWDRAKGLFESSPYGLRRYRSENMRAAVLDHCRLNQIDAIVCDTIDSLIHVDPEEKVPIVVNNHNVEHLILERYLEHEKNPLKRLYASLEARKLRSWEGTACNRGTLVWVCSEFDRQILQKLCPETRFRVVPNAIDVNSYVPQTAKDEPGVVLYTGGMDWYPNRDAVEFFVREILPPLEAAAPEAKFVVAGRAPSPEFLQRIRRHNVVFTGTVPDMRTEIVRASVCVVPLRIGSGTRLKILEAAAMGKPIVSTSLGAEGLTFVPGKEIAIADRPAEFARAVAHFLRNPNVARESGAAARSRVIAEYGFDSLRRAISESLTEAFGQRLQPKPMPEFAEAR